MKKAMNILFIIDPLEELELATDTSFSIMKETYRRGHRVWMCDLLRKMILEAIFQKAAARRPQNSTRLNADAAKKSQKLLSLWEFISRAWI